MLGPFFRQASSCRKIDNESLDFTSLGEAAFHDAATLAAACSRGQSTEDLKTSLKSWWVEYGTSLLLVHSGGMGEEDEDCEVEAFLRVP